MVSQNWSKINHRLSKIFQPLSVAPKNAEIKHRDITSKSQRLMLELGIIRQSSPGSFHFLPLGVKALEKLITLVDHEMRKIGGQKFIFPTLTSSKLWEQTGRLEAVASELFTVQDRHGHDYILSPTHEEAVSDLLSSVSPISYKQLPLKLYQITSKYRDEMKPRFGLIRGKQFIMKDMYSFDVDLAAAKETYNEISNSYSDVFKEIGIEVVRVLGSSGHMGGDLSHEYHYKANIGEDRILSCSRCGFEANFEVTNKEDCPSCGSKATNVTLGIEVGHTFILGEKYSRPLDVTYLTQDGKPNFVHMGSYGLGISRILAAALEVLSTDEEIRWPLRLAPYTVIILPPKSGSKEEAQLEAGFVEGLFSKLECCNPRLRNNVLVDDRTNLTIGRRYLEARKSGYPYILVLGKRTLEKPKVMELSVLDTMQQLFLSENDLLTHMKEKLIF